MINIKKGGSVWKLATFWGIGDLSPNVCHVFWMAVLCLLCLTAVGGGGTIVIGVIVAHTIAAILTGTFLFNSALGPLVIVLTVVGIVGTGIYLSDKVANLVSSICNKATATEAAKVIGAAWTAHKEKFCLNNIREVE